MVNKSENNKHLIDQETRFNELLKRTTHEAKFICINYYENPLNEKSLGNNKNPTNCDIIEIVTHIPISTKKFGDLMKNAGYRIFDVTYEPDGLHFFVQKIGERKT